MRRSTVGLHRAPQPGAGPARVYTVELAGDVTFVQVHPGAAIVVISLSPDIRVAPDEAVWPSIDQDRIHLFDGKTQLALHTE